jgi:peptidoglycan hydrolase-like protein with peptidoglycan-binding domain
VSRLLRAVGVLAVPVVTVPAGMAGAHAATSVPKPPSKSLPSALDVAPPYQGQQLCDPHAKPGVVAFAQLMVGTYKVGSAAPWYMERNCNNGVTEHSDGRAWDWMLNVDKPQEKAIADAVTQWLSAPDAQGRPGAMARRFGIMYIIWNKKMWRAYDPGRGWAVYTGSAPHTDHIHFSFSWDGAYGRTSWWTGKALATVSPGPAIPATPKPTTPPTAPSSVYSILLQGATGADVALAQKVIGATPDGVFGPKTAAALKTWQGKNGLKVTGQLDLATWAKMVALGLAPARSNTPAPTATPPKTPSPSSGSTTSPPASTSPLAAYAKTTVRRGSTGAGVVALQKTLKVTADGAFGPKTEAAVKAFQARKNLPANGIVGPTTWAALMGQSTATPQPSRSTPSSRTTTPYTAYVTTTLRSGSRGEAVKVLQRALGGLAVDGAYGQRTVAAVTAFQKKQRLTVTGVTDAKVWRALETRDYPLRAYYDAVLRQGSRGSAVVALQKALRITADGAYGPRTTAAVKALQGRAKLARTGTVAAVTWKALEAELRRR